MRSAVRSLATSEKPPPGSRLHCSWDESAGRRVWTDSYAHSRAHAWADWSLLDQTTSFCCRNLYGSLVNCKCPIVFTFLPVPCPGRTRPTSTAQHSYSSCRHIPKISAIPFSKPCNTPSRSSLRRKWVRQKSFAKQNAV